MASGTVGTFVSLFLFHLTYVSAFQASMQASVYMLVCHGCLARPNQKDHETKLVVARRYRILILAE